MLFRLVYIIYIPLICLVILHPVQALTPQSMLARLGIFVAGGGGTGGFFGYQIELEKKEILKLVLAEAALGVSIGLLTELGVAKGVISEIALDSPTLMFIQPACFTVLAAASLIPYAYCRTYARRFMRHMRGEETKQELETIVLDSQSVQGME
jgi:hypothetical protein